MHAGRSARTAPGVLGRIGLSALLATTSGSGIGAWRSSPTFAARSVRQGMPRRPRVAGASAGGLRSCTAAGRRGPLSATAVLPAGLPLSIVLGASSSQRCPLRMPTTCSSRREVVLRPRATVRSWKPKLAASRVASRSMCPSTANSAPGGSGPPRPARSSANDVGRSAGGTTTVAPPAKGAWLRLAAASMTALRQSIVPSRSGAIGAAAPAGIVRPHRPIAAVPSRLLRSMAASHVRGSSRKRLLARGRRIRLYRASSKLGQDGPLAPAAAAADCIFARGRSRTQRNRAASCAVGSSKRWRSATHSDVVAQRFRAASVSGAIGALARTGLRTGNGSEGCCRRARTLRRRAAAR
mmetsp:Transcript_97034/g.250980  ORF Transcript_97034/g.250980 Transcript_97034/m.250980 type:complete len:353 (+) Transcript_97034:1268-2326(+)